MCPDDGAAGNCISVYSKGYVTIIDKTVTSSVLQPIRSGRGPHRVQAVSAADPDIEHS